MNVSVVDREAISGQGARKVLIVNKDFAAGEIIYKALDIFCAKMMVLMNFFHAGIPSSHRSRPGPTKKRNSLWPLSSSH